MTRFLPGLGLVAVAAGLQPGQPAPPAFSLACDVAALQAAAPAGTTITAAAIVEATAAMPRLCQVDGQAASVGNHVTFRLALPSMWNGRFLFLGVGGLGGTIPPLDGGVVRGYATASTDTGHEASDPSWAGDRNKEIDYGYRGTHVATVAAKAVTAAYFGAAPRYAYFSGCSNGGRQALMEAQRYPDDYDGIVAGHPATGTPMQVGRALVYQQMLASADRYLTEDAIESLSAATLAACDRTDGLVDGLVSDPRRCTFDPGVIACREGQATGCLTPGQVETARLIYQGTQGPDGRPYAHGFPPGHEGGPTGWRQWIAGTKPPAARADGSLAYEGNPLPAGYGLMDFNFRFLALEVDEADYTWRRFDPARDLPRLKVMTDILSPLDPDLRPFRAAGGRLLLYHGWADPGISALGTLAYYEDAVRLAGGQAAADQFLRAYFIPGLHHCGGGPGLGEFDMLGPMAAWVERGVAPAAIVAARRDNGALVRTRPLCPHPQVATYRGTGSIDEAASFVCR